MHVCVLYQWKALLQMQESKGENSLTLCSAPDWVDVHNSKTGNEVTYVCIKYSVFEATN